MLGPYVEKVHDVATMNEEEKIIWEQMLEYDREYAMREEIEDQKDAIAVAALPSFLCTGHKVQYRRSSAFEWKDVVVLSVARNKVVIQFNFLDRKGKFAREEMNYAAAMVSFRARETYGEDDSVHASMRTRLENYIL